MEEGKREKKGEDNDVKKECLIGGRSGKGPVSCLLFFFSRIGVLGCQKWCVVVTPLPLCITLCRYNEQSDRAIDLGTRSE
jgi:hypothetical protein